MHIDNKNNKNDQVNAALAANIHTAIVLWEAKDWTAYKTSRDALLDLIRSGRRDAVGLDQMQFIYFINTHLRHRFARPMEDEWMFLMALPGHHPAGDEAWRIATEGRFWTEAL